MESISPGTTGFRVVVHPGLKPRTHLSSYTAVLARTEGPGVKGSVASRPLEAPTRASPGTQGRGFRQGLPTAAPTWTGASGEVSLHRPQLLPVLQLVDQLRSGDRTPWAWRKRKTRGFCENWKTSQSRVRLQDVDLRMKLLPGTQNRNCDPKTKDMPHCQGALFLILIS